MVTTRTKDTYQKQVYDFVNDVYVVCPSCNGQALVKSPGLNVKTTDEHNIKLVCTKCGHSKRLDEKPPSVLALSSRKITTGRYFRIGGAIDPYFHLPLWLTTTCGNNILWAYNFEHLDFLHSHVEAKLRERNTQQMANKSLGSRLPRWMTSKKNRAQVLKCLDELRSKK